MASQTANSFYVYVHLRADTGVPFYVGKGCGRRAHQKHGRSQLWQRTAAKHGVDVKLIATGLNEREAFALEVKTIAGLEGLCNFTAGGEGACGYSHTPEAKAALSAAHKGRPHKPEHIEARAAKLRGQKRSEAFCVRLGEIHRGRKHSEETRSRMSAAHVGMKMPAAGAEKLAALHRGMKRSEESRARMSAASAVKRAVRCATNGTLFDSIEGAAKWLRENGWPKATKTGVWFSASGKRKSSYGLDWEYA